MGSACCTNAVRMVRGAQKEQAQKKAAAAGGNSVIGQDTSGDHARAKAARDSKKGEKEAKAKEAAEKEARAAAKAKKAADEAEKKQKETFNTTKNDTAEAPAASEEADVCDAFGDLDLNEKYGHDWSMTEIQDDKITKKN